MSELILASKHKLWTKVLSHVFKDYISCVTSTNENYYEDLIIVIGLQKPHTQS